MKVTTGLTLTALLAFAGLVCAAAPSHPFSAAELRVIFGMTLHNKQPPRDPSNRVSGDPEAIEFGRKLFFDTRLSGDGEFACASCHQPDKGLADGTVKTALRGTELSRHTPALWNLAWSRWFFWDGSADSLWMQAGHPIEATDELNGSRLQIANWIKTDSVVRQHYEQVFTDFPAILDASTLPAFGKPLPETPSAQSHLNWTGLSQPQQDAVNTVFSNINKVIAAFEETLVAHNSPFDAYARALFRRDREAIAAYPEDAARGLKLFIGKARCINCHSGPNLTDHEFHTVFLNTDEQDLGRYDGIPALLDDEFSSDGPYSDLPGTQPGKTRFLYRSVELRKKFKTPTLRNVAASAPYMHTGEMASLEQVIGYYNTISARIRSGNHDEVVLSSLNLEPREQTDLLAFLRSLTDEQSLVITRPGTY